MARFHGKVGYGNSVDVGSGVWEEQIVEYEYFGDVVRNTSSYDNTQKVVGDLSVGNSISIVADQYAREHFSAMRYVVWAGVRWVVQEIEVLHPRLLLRLGGVYNGPTV